MITSRTIGAHLAEAPGPRLFVVFWGGLALVDVSRAWDAPTTLEIALLAGVAVACSIGQATGTAVALAGVAWLVVTGFVVNPDGALRLTGPADALRLGVLVAVAVAAAGQRR